MPRIGQVGWVDRLIDVSFREVAEGEEGEASEWQVRSCFARVYGRLAVHESLSDDGKWAVTSTTTKLCCCRVGTEKDAKLIAEELWGRFKGAFLLSNPEDVVNALPRWVPQWLAACAARGKHLKVKFKEPLKEVSRAKNS